MGISTIGFILKSVIPWVCIALACNLLINFIMYFDLNKRAYNHVPGSCHAIAGIEDGAEDIELLAGGMIVVTAGLRYYNAPELNATKGKVFLYNISGNSAWELTINSKRLSMKSFNPHGLTSWADKKGKVTVYVINHHPRGDRVEVFLLDKKNHALNHTKTIRDADHFHSLHDLVAVGSDKFFASNYHYFNSSFGKNLEIYLGLSMGSIVFYNGSTARSVQRWTKSPNGLALDQTRRYMFVANTLNSAISVYKIESYSNGSISLYDEIPIGAAPVKVHCNPNTGDLYVGCLPVKYRYFLHEGRPKTMMSPSVVIRLKGKITRKVWDATSLFSSDGATLSGSSAAVRYKEQILIGSIHDKLLKCDIAFPESL